MCVHMCVHVGGCVHEYMGARVHGYMDASTCLHPALSPSNRATAIYSRLLHRYQGSKLLRCSC